MITQTRRQAVLKSEAAAALTTGVEYLIDAPLRGFVPASIAVSAHLVRNGAAAGPIPALWSYADLAGTALAIAGGYDNVHLADGLPRELPEDPGLSAPSDIPQLVLRVVAAPLTPAGGDLVHLGIEILWAKRN